MAQVRITAEARNQFAALPITIQARVQRILAELAAWPHVSGVKPIRGALKGAYRKRTGDWRVLFTVDGDADQVLVFRIANRRDVYEA